MKRVFQFTGFIFLGSGLVLMALWGYAQRGSARLTWLKPEVKHSIHTFAYKVYADSQLRDGRFFLSKIVFKNEGNKPVRDFSISYQVPRYVTQTTPETLPEIPPGFTVVKLFYPQFAPEVTKLRETTLATLEIKLQWKEARKAHEEVLRQDFQLRGVNEIEYTDMPIEEVVTEQDLELNNDLLAAMVTKNDPVVAAYASEIVARMEGAIGGASRKIEDVVKFLKGTYEYMQETGLQYAGGVAREEEARGVRTTVQTVRMPRDVILNNNGLCVELALLWASLMEHVNIRAEVVLVPNHAFVKSRDAVIPLKSGIMAPLTVECTAITPEAVQRKDLVSFDEAVLMALSEYNRWSKEGRIYTLDVESLQKAGITPPELADVDVDKLKDTLAGRRKAAAPQSETRVVAQRESARQTLTDTNPATAAAVDPRSSTDQGAAKRRGGYIFGEAFGKTLQGEVKMASGCVVHLDPVNAYSSQLYRKLVQMGPYQQDDERRTVPQLDPQLLRDRRNTRANGQGRFSFLSVPAGDYYVSCYVSWLWFDGRTNLWTGRWHVAKVRLADGERQRVIVF